MVLLPSLMARLVKPIKVQLMLTFPSLQPDYLEANLVLPSGTNSTELPRVVLAISPVGDSRSVGFRMAREDNGANQNPL